MMNEKPVVTVNGKEYTWDELTSQQQSLVQEVTSVDQEFINAERIHFRATLYKEWLTKSLLKSFEEGEEEEEGAKE